MTIYAFGFYYEEFGFSAKEYFRTRESAEKYRRMAVSTGPALSDYLEWIRGKTLRDFYRSGRRPVDPAGLDRSLNKFADGSQTDDWDPSEYHPEDPECRRTRIESGYFESGLGMMYTLDVMLRIYYRGCKRLWDLEEIRRVCEEMTDEEGGPELTVGENGRPELHWDWGDETRVLAKCECWKRFARNWILKNEERWIRASSSPVPRPSFRFIGRGHDGILRLHRYWDMNVYPIPAPVLDWNPDGSEVREIEVRD